jgi:hypothetical protein
MHVCKVKTNFIVHHKFGNDDVIWWLVRRPQNSVMKTKIIGNRKIATTRTQTEFYFHTKNLAQLTCHYLPSSLIYDQHCSESEKKKKILAKLLHQRSAPLIPANGIFRQTKYGKSKRIRLRRRTFTSDTRNNKVWCELSWNRAVQAITNFSFSNLSAPRQNTFGIIEIKGIRVAGDLRPIFRCIRWSIVLYKV